MKLLLMADGAVGRRITEWLFRNYVEDIAFVVAIKDDEICEFARKSGVPFTVFAGLGNVAQQISSTDVTIDLGLLAWWPKIITKPLLGIPAFGFINTHPSLLPFNRGKHYNFWALVEQAPFGVSLHIVDESIDSGDIVAQCEIPYDWLDNGGTLYEKASDSMVRLLMETYPMLRTLKFKRVPQDLSKGSFHRAEELEPASQIHLDERYVARDLFNLLRARTFAGYPACWFSDGGENYEVRVNITRKPQ